MSAAAPALFLYRWRLRAGMEDAFVAAWSDATRALLAHGSLGSRLHRGDDGLWYGYAQWPDAAMRDAAFAAIDPSAAGAHMRDCVAESLPPLALTPVADFLRPLPAAAPFQD
jgi:hypothetical protein